jgi:hypothetical protein
VVADRGPARCEVSAFRWQEQHDSALIEAALTSGAWHADRWGVVVEVLFDTEQQWEEFRGLPVVRAALDAVPDPVNGLLIYPGRSGGGCPAAAPAQARAGLGGRSAARARGRVVSGSGGCLRADRRGRPVGDGKGVTAAAGTWRPGLARMMLTGTVPVLRLPVRGTEELAATGRSITGREFLKRSHAPEPPI